MILVRLLFVVIINLLLGCASAPPTPIDSGVKQVEKGQQAASKLPDGTPGKADITNALETCRANLPAYEATVRDLTAKLETCNGDRLSLSKSAGKGEGFSFLLWVALGLGVGYFAKWIIGRVFKVGA